MERIKDYNTYTKGMKKTLEDKAWFVKHIPSHIDTLVDFGCADGAFIEYIERTYPCRFANYIAIDNDDVMLRKASKRLSKYKDRVHFCLGLDGLIFSDVRSSVLVLNSVLHEVFSYCEPKEYDEFFANLRRLDFPFVAIRDMNADIDGWEHQSMWELGQTLKGLEPEMWNSMDKWGLDSIDAASFILKYRYQENWAREKDERYLWNIEHIIQRELCMHKLQEVEKFYIPFIFEQASKDFGMEIAPFNTHIKMLLVA